jgi:hypothetical protein
MPASAAPNDADRDVLAAVDLQRVALGVLDREVLDHEVARLGQQAFGTGDLVAEGQDRLLHARAAHRDAVDAQRQAAIEVVATGGNLDDGARLGVEKLLLQLLGEGGVHRQVADAPARIGGWLVAAAQRQRRGDRDEREGDEYRSDRAVGRVGRVHGSTSLAAHREPGDATA